MRSARSASLSSFRSVACTAPSIDRFHSRDKNLDNRCHAAILVYQSVSKPESRPLNYTGTVSDSVQARYFVSGQAAISGDRYNVDWVSLILGNDKKKNKIKEILNKCRGENRGRNQKEQKELKRLLAQEIAAKKRGLNRPGGQMFDIVFENESLKAKLEAPRIFHALPY